MMRAFVPLAATLLGAAAAPSGQGAAPLRSGLDHFRAGHVGEALEDWEAAADDGSARAALYIGILFDTGQGVPHDLAQAIYWYHRAATAGSAAAAFNLGVLYDAGIGGPKDAYAASVWYQIAAERGYGRAEYDLAQLYESGDGVVQSRAHAAALYRRAALHGIPAARAHLVAMGFSAMLPARPSANQDNSEFDDYQHALKQFLHRGAAPPSNITVLVQKYSAQHNPFAEFDLGFCFEHGIGVGRDAAQAATWYRRAEADAKDDTLRHAASDASLALATKLHARMPADPERVNGGDGKSSDQPAPAVPGGLPPAPSG